MGGTSRTYLRSRLLKVGRSDLVKAAESGLISFFAAAEEANLVTRPPTRGTGSMNASRSRMWAMAKVTGRTPRLAPKAEPQPKLQPGPLPPEIRAIITKLVRAGRDDLICDVAEERCSPFEAEAIVDRGEPSPTPKAAEIIDRGEPPRNRAASRRAVSPRTPKHNGKAEPETRPKKEEPPRYDVKAMIA